MKNRWIWFVLIGLFLFAGEASATLWDRGAGLIYDDELNVTWLANANYALTSNYVTPGGRSVAETFGRMNWNEAGQWANQLSYGGLTGWRLPGVSPVNGITYGDSVAPGGSSDFGYNISASGTPYAGSTASELAYMFYNNLSNTARYDASWSEQPGWGLQNSGSFAGLQAEDYWTGTLVPLELGRGEGAFFFGFYSGYQGSELASLEYNLAWALRDGDVNGEPPMGVPEPSVLILLCMGVAGVFELKRRRAQDH